MESENRLNELNRQIIDLENKIAPLYEEKEAIYLQRQAEVQAKLAACLNGEYAFKPEELRFATSATCTCGAKLAYPKGIGMYGSWYCSDVLLDRNADQEHIEPIPFLESNID